MSFMQKLGFGDLTHMLDRCVEATSTSQRDQFMQKFFEKVLALQNKYKTEAPNGDTTLYPLLRIIMSTHEHERAYGLQEIKLRQLLIKSFGIAGNDAKRIEQCNEDEIGDAVYEVLKSNNKSSQLSIADVDDALNELANSQKGDNQKHQLDKLFLRGSARDLKWIAKIILKNMKLKVSSAKILEKIHPLGGKLFAKYNHLSTVLEFIEKGRAAEAMKDVIKPFTPIRAMLSQKLSKDMNNILEKFELYQELKMDGDRFQLHMENQEFKYFSRNAHDFSKNFNLLITPLIKFKVIVHSVILDGEMVVWNKMLKRIVSKGETDMDVKKISDININIRPCFCVFDILYLNGTSFVDQPFVRRCELLHSLFDDCQGVMVKTNPVKLRDVDHLVSQFNAAMEKEEEGIILKKADSIYMPGEREKGGWYKMKADYFDGEVVREFDCVIIGGCFQNAHTRDYIQKYLVGAVEKQEDGTFNLFSIGEVVTGISMAERMKLHEKLIQVSVDFNGGSVIEYERGKIFFGKNKPNVIIPPHKSFVLQIRASELAPSSEYYTEYSFRFQRIEAIRYDKFWDESCTLKEFRDLYTTGDGDIDGRVIKVNKRNVHKGDILSPGKKRRVASTKSRARAIENFCHNSQEDVEPLDKILAGLEFCVKTTSPNLPSTQDLKLLLKLHGANLTEFPRKKKTFAVLAGDIEQQIKIYITQRSISVIKADWLVNNFTKESPLDEFPKLGPLDFHFLTDELYEEKFKHEYDKYGDSYFEPIESEDHLKAIVNNVREEGGISQEQLSELESEIYAGYEGENFKIFRGYRGHFIYGGGLNDTMMDWSEMVFQFRGGEVNNEQDDANLLIFVDKSTFSMESHLEFKHRLVVDYRFIIDSSDANAVAAMSQYRI